MLTVAQIDAKLAELEEARDELILLPTEGTIGRTSVKLGDKKLDQIEGRISDLRLERAALLNGGRALRPRRGCC